MPQEKFKYGERGGGMGGNHRTRGLTDEWYTPAALFDALGIRFDLDPASPPGGLPWVPADRHFSLADDGLSQTWRGRVWLNPPYGRAVATWLERFVQHGDGIALVFARTDTRWFHRLAPLVDLVCFIEGRLTFVAGDGSDVDKNAGAPSMLLVMGTENVEAVRAANIGLCVSIDRGELAQHTLL